MISCLMWASCFFSFASSASSLALARSALCCAFSRAATVSVTWFWASSASFAARSASSFRLLDVDQLLRREVGLLVGGGLGGLHLVLLRAQRQLGGVQLVEEAVLVLDQRVGVLHLPDQVGRGL